MDQTIPAFNKGVYNLLNAENIPADSAQDALNFLSVDGKQMLAPGRQALGAEGSVGGTQGFHKGYKVDGSTVLYCKMGTKIKYYDGSAWQDCITGLSATDEYTFANYSSLAGAFTFVNGPGAYYKIINAVPASPVDVYNSSKNFYGYILIDKSRTLLWNRSTDKTGLYGSYIDRQDSTVYTTVSGEALGVLGSTNYTGTLAFKGGGARRTCFGVSITATTGAGTETFTDNFLGVLTSNFGGTGTINYATGAYNVTFANTTTGAVTGNYQWEDSSLKGVADFSKSGTRLAGEGFQFPQDEGGDAILSVQIGQDGVYYSLKEKSAYSLSIDVDDLGATNQVFRKEMGLPYFRAALSTNKGIFFINTANPTNPVMTILQKQQTGNFVEPVTLFGEFDFANYTYDHAAFATYDRWIAVFCRTPKSTTNNRILMCNLESRTVDIVGYTGNMGIQSGSKFYVADSVQSSVYDTFSGFDDLGNSVVGFWKGRDETMGTSSGKGVAVRTDDLKKFRKLKFKGNISLGQSVGVYLSYDSGAYTLVGTIYGGASYVNRSLGQAIGGSLIGVEQVGGDDATNVYPYYMEMKVRPPKFRKVTMKLVPDGIGHFDFNLITYNDLLLFENRMPTANRQKQRVSLDGTATNQ